MASADTIKKSLKDDFGYGFNADGKLRQLDKNTGELTEQGFVFVNQQHYEELGETITDEVYKLLDNNGMHRIYLPEGKDEKEATFVYSSQEKLTNVDKLLLIIHGSGVVRAGQWARSLIINHSLDSGTVLPYVKLAQARGYEVLITNTNDNRRNGKFIPGSESPEKHANTVWEKIVKPSNAKTIAVVAHSYGGVVVSSLSSKYKEDFEKKVIAVALTDSVHGSRGLSSRLTEIGINYVSSSDPLSTPQRNYNGDIKRVSAGHIKHEMTSFSCMDALFELLDSRLKAEREEDGSQSPESKKAKTDEL